MFTITAVANPLATETNRVAKMIVTRMCDACGSTNVSVRHGMIGRDDMVRITCRNCGANEDY